MQPLYLIAGGLSAVTGLVHSILGERLIFQHLRNRSVVPAMEAPPLRQRHIGILWATWHLASVFGWAFAGVLIHLAFAATSADSFVINAIVFAYLGAGALVFVGSRGRHPGWAALVSVALLTWLAS